jgi:ribosomal protein S18 acetylase RimI-like enzyme
MTIRKAGPGDQDGLTQLIAGYRVALKSYRGIIEKPDQQAAARELAEYQVLDYPVFVAEDKSSGIIGYLVCRVADTVVWAESLYVAPKVRRQGIGSALYAKAEELVAELGGETIYNWVHPNNDGIISFLKRRGYNVLNLIELRKKGIGETIRQKIRVGKHGFDY